MSLINDALVDLAARRLHVDDVRAIDKADQLSADQRFGLFFLPPVAVFLVVLVIAASVLVVLSNHRSLTANSPLVSDKKESNTGKKRHADTDVSFSSSAQKPLVTLSAHNDGDKQEHGAEDKGKRALKKVGKEKVDWDQQEVDRLLGLAEQCFLKNRLSLPQGDNALMYLHKVLSLKKNSVKAQGLIAQVKQSYRRQLDTALRRKDARSAKHLLARAGVFGLHEHEKKDITERLAFISIDDAQPSTSVQVKKANTEKNGIAHKTENDTENKMARVVSDKSQSHFTLSIQQHDIDTLSKAKRLLEKEGLAAAQKMLSQFIQTEPEAFHARIFFVDLALANHDIAAVNNALASASPSNGASDYIKARVLALDSGGLSAISFLEEKQRNTRLNTYEKGYLAGMYQKHKQDEKAFSLYKNLVHDNPKDARFLLGYAITADTLSHYSQSIKAYKEVLQRGHSDAKVLAFIRSRLAQLEAYNLAGATSW